MSPSSSFLRLILSLRPSASRRDAVILACICSPLISAAMVTEPLRESQLGAMTARTTGGDWGSISREKREDQASRGREGDR